MIRRATEQDCEEILSIYSYYVENTAASFETDPPSRNAFLNRIQSIIGEYPYFVCTMNEEIVGYAYASKHRERAAYRYDVDVSVYVRNGMLNKGIGTALFSALFEALSHSNYYNAYAAIALPNEKSVALHRKFGFEEIGIHHKTGFKFGKWHDVLWMEKTIKEHSLNTEI